MISKRKFFIISILFTLLFTLNANAQSRAELGNLVLKLICLLFYIIPAVMALLISIGAVFIITGDETKRNKGKKLILNSFIASFILIFLAWLVTLTSPQLKFSDYALCFSENGTLQYPTTSTISGMLAPWADARVGITTSPPPEEKEVYTGKNAPVYFDGSNSKDFDGSIVDYEWNFGDSSAIEKGVKVSHSYSADGTYTAELKVTDNSGLSDTDIVKIYILPLEAHILKPKNGQIFIYPNDEIKFEGEAKYGAPCMAPNEPYKYNWQSNLKGFLSNEKSFVLKASDLGLGMHSISLTVTDCAGNTAEDSITIIINMPLFVEILNPKNDNEKFDCDEKFKGNVSGGTPPYKVTWKANGKIFSTGTINVDGGTHETEKRPSPPGKYDITFEAVDKYGSKADDMKKEIEVIPCSPCDVYKATGVLPNKFDWRNYNGKDYNSPVKNQGRCGSCWAHSVIGAMEGTYNVEQDNPDLDPNLAEQCLVGCCKCAYGCAGCPFAGWPSCPLNYLKSPGTSTESQCAYTASNSPCCSSCSSNTWKIKNWGSVPSDSKKIKEALICNGPLAVASFAWRHAIVLSGYDDTQGVWIIKNSWGTGWGQGGYGRIPYNGAYGDIVAHAAYVDGVTPP
ncbi:MAG: C1 family peptidase [Candidatus Altiarchaeota archaeon]